MVSDLYMKGKKMNNLTTISKENIADFIYGEFAIITPKGELSSYKLRVEEWSNKINKNTVELKK